MSFEQVILHGAEIFHEIGEKCRNDLYNDHKDIKLTESQRFYVQCIASLKEPTLSAISCKLAIAKSSVSIAIEKLIKLGYVTKSKHKNDKRISLLRLTDLGERAVFLDKEVHRLATERIKHILSEAEIKQLTDIFNKIINYYDNEWLGDKINVE